MKNLNNLNFILEIFWLIISISTFVLAVFNFIKFGIGNSYVFFIMALLSFLLYMARRTLRRKEARKK